MNDIPDERAFIKEKAANEPRHWVRLTKLCNNRCIFCLDTDSQDGTVVSFEDVTRDLESGISRGCSKVILSGGEATLHPEFKSIVRHAKKLGYNRIQLVTNGRLFAYSSFLEDAVQSGLGEVTFSIHGHTPELHDAQTRVPGSFHQTLAGLMNALERDNLIVNMDIVINKMNYRHLREIMEYFIRLGVHEFDLLHITPFGDAWRNREKLFYDPSPGMKYLNNAFSCSSRKDLFVWTNRFPPGHLAAFPELVQNPSKLKDEIRGRKEQFDNFLTSGKRLSCYGARCRFCFINGFCKELFMVKKSLDKGTASHVRTSIDTLGNLSRVFPIAPQRFLIIHGNSVSELADSFTSISSLVTVQLEFKDYSALDELLAGFPHIKFIATADTPENIESLLQLKGITVHAVLNTATSDFISKHTPYLLKRACVTVKNPAGLADAKQNAVNLHNFFKTKSARVFRTQNLPGCLIRTEPSRRPRFVDTSFIGPDGEIELFSFAQFYIENRYYVFPTACEKCSKRSRCPGVHIEYFRAHGFKPKPFSNKMLTGGCKQV